MRGRALGDMMPHTSRQCQVHMALENSLRCYRRAWQHCAIHLVVAVSVRPGQDLPYGNGYADEGSQVAALRGEGHIGLPVVRVRQGKAKQQVVVPVRILRFGQDPALPVVPTAGISPVLLPVPVDCMQGKRKVARIG